MESPTLEMRPEETVHFCSVTWENQITQLQLQLGWNHSSVISLQLLVHPAWTAAKGTRCSVCTQSAGAGWGGPCLHWPSRAVPQPIARLGWLIAYHELTHGTALACVGLTEETTVPALPNTPTYKRGRKTQQHPSSHMYSPDPIWIFISGLCISTISWPSISWLLPLCSSLFPHFKTVPNPG